MEPFIVTVPPKAEDDLEFNRHLGEEFIYMEKVPPEAESKPEPTPAPPAAVPPAVPPTSVAPSAETAPAASPAEQTKATLGPKPAQTAAMMPKILPFSRRNEQDRPKWRIAPSGWW